MRNPERLAWTVLIVAFAVFCAFLIAVPVSAKWYLGHAMTEKPARLEVLKGTVLLLPSGARQEVNAANESAVTTGDRIRTAPNSEALLSFFDGSNVHLWPDTTIRILTTETTTYRPNQTDFVLAQDQGHARYEVALPATDSRSFEVQTPQGSSVLRDGSYKVEIVGNTTTVTVSTGSATVSGEGQALEVLKDERTSTADLGTPSRPEPAVRNLVANGDFSQGLNLWQPGNRDVEDNVPGRVFVAEQDTRTFAEFSRIGSQHHAETFLHQALNQDVTDYGSLLLKFQVKIQRQTLSGGGILGSEYPLLVRVHYRDATGTEYTWVRGFYVDNPDHLPTTFGLQVTQNLWTDQSVDLFDPSTVSPRPSEILWLEIAGSGWEYQSDVAGVQLLAE